MEKYKLKKSRFLIILMVVIGLSIITFFFLNQKQINKVYNCGNEVCESGEDKLSCPIDCGIPSTQCGNNICEYPENEATCSSDCKKLSPPQPQQKCGDEVCEISETASSCPIDCGTPIISTKKILCPFGVTNQCFDNTILVPNLNKKNLPLKQGTVIHIDYGGSFGTCTIGAIIQTGGKNYILTAGHCITGERDNIPRSTDLNRNVEQENSDDKTPNNNVIGRAKKWDSSGRHDVALIEINSGIDFSTGSFLSDRINGFREPKIGMEVFKVGRTTGLTFGKIVEIANDYFVVEGKNGEVFGGAGDSGATIMTISDPTQIVGVLTGGINDYSNDGGKTSRRVVSPLPQNIINSLNII